MSSTFKKNLRRFRARGERSAIVVALAFFSGFSRRRILHAARCLGDLGFLLARSHRRQANANLDIIYGVDFSKKRRRAIIRSHFRNAARVLLDILWFSHESRARLASWSSLDPAMRTWLDANPGAIIVTGHLGNWEVAGQTIASLGYPVTSVAKRIGTAGTTQRINHVRRRLGQKIVMADGAVRGLMRAMQAGDFVALLIDQHVDPGQGGLWIDLFGLPAAVSSVPARLAQRFNVPVAVCFSQTLPDGRCCFRLLGVCEAGEVVDPVRMTQHIMDLMAGAIRRYPSQWLLCYKRWKRWPPGADATRYPAYARPWKPPPS